jgi:glycosyltransferase involved in cell wall biosynthesis
MTPRPPLPVSVVIPVKNEERNLPACLARLGRFAEVVVVDSASTDRTCAIAAAAGARVIPFAWNGRYPKKRNHVLLEERLAAPWVLFLDADEHVSEAWCDEAAAALAGTDKAGFWLNYTNHFLGRELKHGVAQRKLALLRVGAGLYERIEEENWSGLDMEIHEHPVLSGPAGEIVAKIDHRDVRGLDRFFARHIDYAKWEAARWRALHAGGLAQATHLTGRQRFKYRHLGKWWYFLFYFAFAYGAKGGFLDGRAGFDHAFFKAWYFRAIAGMIAEAGPPQPAPRRRGGGQDA